MVFLDGQRYYDLSDATIVLRGCIRIVQIVYDIRFDGVLYCMYAYGRKERASHLRRSCHEEVFCHVSYITIRLEMRDCCPKVFFVASF